MDNINWKNDPRTDSKHNESNTKKSKKLKPEKKITPAQILDKKLSIVVAIRNLAILLDEYYEMIPLKETYDAQVMLNALDKSF